MWPDRWPKTIGFKELRHDDRPGRRRKRLPTRPGSRDHQEAGRSKSEVGGSLSSVQRTAKKELGLKPSELHKAHLLTGEIKRVRLDRCRQLRERAGNGSCSRMRSGSPWSLLATFRYFLFVSVSYTHLICWLHQTVRGRATDEECAG